MAQRQMTKRQLMFFGPKGVRKARKARRTHKPTRTLGGHAGVKAKKAGAAFSAAEKASEEA